nr:brefeldin A-inhibited guanine nucleotide-exchange protein 1 [Ipomoea batatas]
MLISILTYLYAGLTLLYHSNVDFDSNFTLLITVNGLLKTALGPPPGSTTSLSPAQDMTFRLESVKCLVRIINSMGAWMDQQLKVGESNPVKFSDSESKMENITPHSEEGNLADFELHLEASSEFSNAVTLEQRRAYKLEIQVVKWELFTRKGVSLFNRKPSKGIDFLMNNKKIGNSPEEVASFLKNTSGLNATMIGDYLGEREEFPLKVMHAYVDSFNFEQMDFGEAIRYFLRGFRLPGEAQKIDRIMEKFAERYCKCNPNSFTSAETAYVLAYSVIMLNTDAHNNMVKDKCTLDQSDDKTATALCLQGFRHAVHCYSIHGFEHLQLLGEGHHLMHPFLTTATAETGRKSFEVSKLSFSEEKRNPSKSSCCCSCPGGSYDSTRHGVNSPVLAANDNASDVKCFTDEDDHMSFWASFAHRFSAGHTFVVFEDYPSLTSDPRSAIRKSALDVLHVIKLNQKLKDYTVFPKIWIFTPDRTTFEDRGVARDLSCFARCCCFSSFPISLKLLQTMDNIEMPDISESNNDMETSSEVGSVNDDSEGEEPANCWVAAVISLRCAGSQISAEDCDYPSWDLFIYFFSCSPVKILMESLELKLQRACSILEIPEPPLLHFENESYQNYINFLHDLLVNNRRLGKEKNLEPELVSVCEKILRIYLDCAGLSSVQQQAVNKPKLHWIPPLGSAKKEELAARTPLVLSVLHILSSLEGNTFKKYASQLFPLLVDLVRSEHSSGEVQRVLSGVFQSCIGPIIMNI